MLPGSGPQAQLPSVGVFKRKPGPEPPARPGVPQSPPRLLSTQAAVVVGPPKPRWPKVTAAVVVVLALLGTGAFALTSILGSSGQGGERTPEAAIEKFLAAAGASDVLGVVDSLLPSEREAWIEPMKQLFVDGRRLQVLPATADADAVRGLSVRLESQATAAELVAPDIAAMPVRGPVVSSVSLAGYNPLGAAERNVSFRVAAVRRGVRWYVSVWHTLAENLRAHSSRQLSWPSTAQSVSLGSASPIEAVSRLLSAVEHLSLKDLIAVLDPIDAAVIQRVAPWFVDGTQQAIDEVVRRSGLSLRLSDPQFVATSKGNNAVVTFSGLQSVVKSNHVNVAVRDNCGIFSTYGQADTRECLGNAADARDALVPELTRLGLPPAVLRGVLLYDDVRRSLDGLSGIGVAVHNVNGLWYVNPTGTVVTMLLGFLANGSAEVAKTTADDLDVLISLLRRGHSGGSAPTANGDTGAVGQAGEPGSVDEYGRYTECLASPTFDLARSCMEQGIANGDFPRQLVDGSFLVPECGWRGSRFDPSITRLSNEEYARLARAAAACLQTRIDSGFLVPLQMPFELVRVECLKGWNPARMNATQSKEYLQCQLAG